MDNVTLTMNKKISGILSVKQVDKISNDIFSYCINKKQKCFVEDCKKSAIQSHLLQKNGILKMISANNHFYEVAFLMFPKPHYEIKKVGINKGFTFRGFCEYHDSKIFEKIEKTDVDFNEYQSLLLLSYRAILKEFRVKEIIIDYYVNLLTHSKLKVVFDNEPILTAVAANT